MGEIIEIKGNNLFYCSDYQSHLWKNHGTLNIGNKAILEKNMHIIKEFVQIYCRSQRKLDIFLKKNL